MSKRKRTKTGRPFRLTVQPQKTPEQGRLAALSMELGIAAMEVLQEKWGFTKEECDLFSREWLDRAKANREALEKMV